MPPLTIRQIEKLGEREPERLIDLLGRRDLSEVELSFAIEALGDACLPRERKTPFFLAALKHSSSTVREGSLRGIARSVPQDSELLKQVSRLLHEDPVHEIRDLAAETMTFFPSKR